MVIQISSYFILTVRGCRLWLEGSNIRGHGKDKALIHQGTEIHSFFGNCHIFPSNRQSNTVSIKLGSPEVLERATTQGSSFEPNQYENFEKTLSFKKTVKSSIPFDEIEDRSEIKKNLNSLYRESFTCMIDEAKERNEKRKHAVGSNQG
jgi:hypothetical protein